MSQPEVHKTQYFLQLGFPPVDQIKQLIRDKDVPLVFIARNPYVRLLSGYIEKHEKNQDFLYWGDNNEAEIKAYMGANRANTFGEFVHLLHKLNSYLGGRLSKYEGVNHHYA